MRLLVIACAAVCMFRQTADAQQPEPSSFIGITIGPAFHGIRELRRALTRRMAEIDTEPGEDTIALADRLVTDLQRRPRGPSRLPRDAA